MANKQIDLNIEAKNETFDLNLRLGNGSSEANKKRKIHEEENMGQGEKLEDRYAALEHKIQRVESLLNYRTHELAIRMDEHFLKSIQSIHEQLGKHKGRLDEIHSILHGIILAFRPGITSGTSKTGGSSSGTKKPPRP